LVSTPKLHFLDSGLLASTQGLTTAGLSMSRVALGPALETFVFSELSKGVPFSQAKPRIQHYRDVGERLQIGMVLYDGPRILPFGPKLYAVLLSTLWSDQ
jgi:uncharacterized protein